MTETHPTIRPILMLVRGLPGSGKSYITTKIATRLGQGRAVVLDPDATDYTSLAYKKFSEQLTSEGVDPVFHPYRFLRSQAYQGIESGKIVIWNQAFTNLDGFQKTINNLTAYAADRSLELPVLVVEVEIDPMVARERVAARAQAGGHDVTSDAFERFISDYRSFADQGYNILSIQGTADTDKSISAIEQRLSLLV